MNVDYTVGKIFLVIFQIFFKLPSLKLENPPPYNDSLSQIRRKSDMKF